ncbi:MAG: tRNA uridine-5-carboxymethylaminomethyl(34) synthesis GTPase MnmE [Desulfotomaculaceae bacterium]|nr:tRNA uridine-5-carboxymethylaminomethyl(34) synthesis GTPase MnmE [Desulfotomaculaceae bacterium]
MFDDTIAAIATPLGEGGIGIVRVSGSEVVKIAKRIFRAKNKNWTTAGSHRLFYGHIVDREGLVVDEALLSYMQAPHTYTREDVVEINCHGGIVPLRRVLELVLGFGARLAEPGEFSKRAFLNGRLDLAQAESVIDIIRAKTDASLKLAMSQLKGELSRQIFSLQHKLLGLLAKLEAVVDFPEEGLEESAAAEILVISQELLSEVEQLIRGAETGKIYRDGISTIIIGSPNVGKSSLLNAMLREDRAIVTEIPGTTRDIIEEIINIRGIPLKIIDTAGLRETEDVVEKIGVARTRDNINRADLVLLVLDAARGLTNGDRAIIESIEEKKLIILLNKVDVEVIKIEKSEVEQLASGRPLLWISAEQRTGLAELEDTIVDMVMSGRTTSSETVLVASVRHKQALEKAASHLTEAISGIRGKLPLDMVSIDLRSAWEDLGEITGETSTDELLDRIFADFCIGK